MLKLHAAPFRASLIPFSRILTGADKSGLWWKRIFSEIFYAHTNYRKSLFLRETEEGMLIATTPLGRRGWEELPFTALCAFKNGHLIRQGKSHGNEYFDNEHDTRLMYLDAEAL